MNRMIVVMGVSGAGKSTVGKQLAQSLRAEFIEGDDFHPQANIEKMRAGIALCDDDRVEWFDVLVKEVNMRLLSGDIVLACSALKEIYRQKLRSVRSEEVIFVCLNGERDLLRQRIENRTKEEGHFMPVKLLDSQYEDFEKPEDGINVDVNRSIEELIPYILKRIFREVPQS